MRSSRRATVVSWQMTIMTGGTAARRLPSAVSLLPGGGELLQRAVRLGEVVGQRVGVILRLLTS